MSQEVCPLRATTKNTPSRRGSRLWHFFSPHFFSFFFFYQRKILVAFLSASAANLSTFQQCCISQCVIPTMHCVVEFKKINKKKKLHKTPVLKSNEIHSNGKHTRKFDCFFFPAGCPVINEVSSAEAASGCKWHHTYQHNDATTLVSAHQERPFKG